MGISAPYAGKAKVGGGGGGASLQAHMDLLVFVEKQGAKTIEERENPKQRRELPLLTGKTGKTQTKGTEQVRKNNSHAKQRKLDAYDDQILSKFIRKPLPMALKAELRTRFLFVGLTLSSPQ